jgi:hypothetical protein
MLPGEAETRRQLGKTFANDFEVAREVFTLACEVGSTLCTQPCRRFSQFTKATCIAALTKLCNQYRSVHALCELGLTDDASIVLRGMFETLLRISFLLRRSTRLRRIAGMPSWAYNVRLSVDARARLLVADILSREEKYLCELGSIPRCRRLAAKCKPLAVRRLQRARQHVSSQVTSSLGKRSMCGLSVKDMAYGLGLREWYVAFYSGVSTVVHASDLDRFLEIDHADRLIVPRLFPDEQTTTLPIKTAGVFVLAALRSIDSRWRLDYGRRIADLSRRVREHNWGFRGTARETGQPP